MQAGWHQMEKCRIVPICFVTTNWFEAGVAAQSEGGAEGKEG